MTCCRLSSLTQEQDDSAENSIDAIMKAIKLILLLLHPFLSALYQCSIAFKSGE
jgi:hypothetical protein